jgi:hypothetical protein
LRVALLAPGADISASFIVYAPSAFSLGPAASTP